MNWRRVEANIKERKCDSQKCEGTRNAGRGGTTQLVPKTKNPSGHLCLLTFCLRGSFIKYFPFGLCMLF